MNNAKMWLVVKPGVGIPLFLGAVAVTSLAVHVGVVVNTSWVSDFMRGQPLGSTADAREAALIDQKAPTVAQAAYVMPEGQSQSVLVILPDGSTAKATLASVTTGKPLVIEH